MPEFLTDIRPIVFAALTALLAIVVSANVVLHKRDVRAAVAWVGLIWLVPVLGSVLYVLFGINRIRRRASALRAESVDIRPLPLDSMTDWRVVEASVAEPVGQLGSLARMVNRVTRRPLVSGNSLKPLLDGDEAYPEMIEAINQAERTIALSTYIFDHDPAGLLFADALGRAVDRGVEVRVLIDAFGARLSWPSIVGTLRKRDIRVARFMQSFFPWRFPFLNLRTHRKIFVVDGRGGFTGGINIREGHILGREPKRPVRDLHFRVEGPVVEHLTQVFAEDWAFSTKELLGHEQWFPALVPVGNVAARGISDGPDEDIDQLLFTLLGAIAAAQRSITIMTPYFLPDDELIIALNVAAMRGVEVTILLPQENNHPLVKWASTALYSQLLVRGCRIFLVPGVFDHSKLMLVDDGWTLLGSANWDPRSLRLNFEFNVECYDVGLAQQLNLLAQERRSGAREVTLLDVERRSLPVRLRDGVARLMTPYL